MVSFIKKIFDTSPSQDMFDDKQDSQGEPSKKPTNCGGPWIGVDLDGTLAEHDMWISQNHIGKPVPEMVKRVRTWVAQGITIKIVTARASIPECIPPVQAWLKKNDLPPFEVTNQKDFNMIELWDDRAIQVIRNTGRPAANGSILSRNVS